MTKCARSRSQSISYTDRCAPSNGPELVAMTGAPLLAQIPIDPEIAMLCDAGKLEDYTSETFDTLAANFTKALAIAGGKVVG